MEDISFSVLKRRSARWKDEQSGQLEGKGWLE
jgi:hypothetical protein